MKNRGLISFLIGVLIADIVIRTVQMFLNIFLLWKEN